MPTGRMVSWNMEKGFGFIKPDDDSPDASHYRWAGTLQSGVDGLVTLICGLRTGCVAARDREREERDLFV